MPVRESHEVPGESCELFNQPQVYNRVKPYGARSLMWPREQHRRKIPTGASLDLAGNKSYGW